jgi:hypothetical protein
MTPLEIIAATAFIALAPYLVALIVVAAIVGISCYIRLLLMVVVMLYDAGRRLWHRATGA